MLAPLLYDRFIQKVPQILGLIITSSHIGEWKGNGKGTVILVSASWNRYLQRIELEHQRARAMRHDSRFILAQFVDKIPLHLFSFGLSHFP